MKKVSENDFLQKIEREVEKLVEPDHNLATKPVDVRIKSFLDYGHRTDTLCLGELSGVILNGQRMEDNATLLELLKSNIYINNE